MLHASDWTEREGVGRLSSVQGRTRLSLLTNQNTANYKSIGLTFQPMLLLVYIVCHHMASRVVASSWQKIMFLSFCERHVRWCVCMYRCMQDSQGDQSRITDRTFPVKNKIYLSISMYKSLSCFQWLLSCVPICWFLVSHQVHASSAQCGRVSSTYS